MTLPSKRSLQPKAEVDRAGGHLLMCRHCGKRCFEHGPLNFIPLCPGCGARMVTVERVTFTREAL
jgi:hypothetical protein